ncbi:MAG TPA: hypothetical protein VEV43_08425 [Actinomycetota bacterium]|nr:hypothetical protein [Actinomycetota bacterium]
MNVMSKLVVTSAAAVTLLFGTSASPVPASEDVRAPISKGSWLGSSWADCSDETGTTGDYWCSFTGEAPADFPPGSYCAETPAAVAVSLECGASLSATTSGKLKKAACFNTPLPNQLTTTNGTVTVFSSATQQSYAVPVKVWVSRGVGKFAGVGNFLLTVVEVSGNFTTTCSILQSRGTFEGEFSLVTAART